MTGVWILGSASAWKADRSMDVAFCAQKIAFARHRAGIKLEQMRERLQARSYHDCDAGWPFTAKASREPLVRKRWPRSLGNSMSNVKTLPDESSTPRRDRS